jgi:hypothetical protein
LKKPRSTRSVSGGSVSSMVPASYDAANAA